MEAAEQCHKCLRYLEEAPTKVYFNPVPEK